MNRKTILVVLSLVSALVGSAQPPDVINAYINTYRNLAVEEMKRTGVPASITLAQGIHETEAGRSELVRKSNNHFGIKCKSAWTGGKVYHDDDAAGECFRSYDDPAISYRDHSDFLRSGARYAFLFKLDPTDYQGWAHGLKKAGYATNIRYPQILIKLIETYNLQQYTLIAMGKLPPLPDAPVLATIDVQKAGPVAAAPVNYPDGVFAINDTRVCFVRGGSSLLAVAENNNLSLARLLEFNDMTPDEGDILMEDQLIYLQRKRKTGANLFHHVQAEETMYDIAQAEGIRYESALELNHLRPGEEPAMGEKIYLKEKNANKPQLQSAAVAQARYEAPVTAANGNAYTTHTVQVRETLFSIAKKYNVSEQQLRDWNRLSGTHLRQGQQLIIYTN